MLPKSLPSILAVAVVVLIGLFAFPYITSYEAAPAANRNAQTKWATVGIPLDVRNEISSASALMAEYDGISGVVRFDEGAQDFVFYRGAAGDNFNIELGGAYFLEIEPEKLSSLRLTGEVVDAGEPVSYQLVGDATTCQWNFITLPLDKTGIADAQALADDIGDVQQVLSWHGDSFVQNFRRYVPDGVVAGGLGTNFEVRVGHAYFVCVSAAKQWP